MGVPARWVLCLCLGWGCLCLALPDPRPDRPGLRRRAATGAPRGEPGPGQRRPHHGHGQGRLAEHMLRLYEQYRGSRDPPGPPLRRGNTVRGFRPLPAGRPEGQEMYVFNLTSLTESEDVLSASVYYHIGDLLGVRWNCSQPSSCSQHSQGTPDIHMWLSLWTFPSAGNQTRSLGHFVINVSSASQDVLPWQWQDITGLLHEAKRNKELLMGVKMALRSQQPWARAAPCCEPYILIYANDSAISEPESVVSTLRGHRAPLAGLLPRADSQVRSSQVRSSQVRSSPGKQRRTRSAAPLLPLQNNELPGAEERSGHEETWEGRKPSRTLQPQLAQRARSKKKPRKPPGQQSQSLQFDEQTLKAARRRQWDEPRACARRYLRVDFADIGWSEWIISPKAFDAYYCSGQCQFPIPKALRPSNHATLQSIVRAVGVVPGVPQPCCVPDTMGSLSILFWDHNGNVLLKVYPNMTVQSCACR